MMFKSLVLLFTLFAFGGCIPVGNTIPTTARDSVDSACFPAIGFSMPSTVPSSLDGWWCDMDTEYGFVGFSYEITACQSSTQLNKEFADIRQTFGGRYIRLYGVCDQTGYYDKIVDAAWDNGLGIHALIWFGFDDDTKWKKRRDNLFQTLHTNPKAKFVTRVLQFGSEPLFDAVLSVSALADQVIAAKTNLTDLQIPVTISELAYGYQENNDAPQIFNAVDLINAHMLPFFSTQASTGDQAWPIINTDLDYFVNHAQGKKIYFSQNGWPSKTSSGVSPNSPSAVASVASEEAYYQLLDAQCETFKTVPGGGVGWFWHIYSDDQEPGYGLYNTGESLKFNFTPRTSC